MTKRDGKETRFMGKITGAVTHEMNNVLAAIGENSALIQDILQMSGKDASPPDKRIMRAFRIIDNQVGRGAEIASRLHAFAHSADHARTEVDLNEVVMHIASLAERLARLKRIILRVAPYDRPLVLVTNPLTIRMALFELLELVFENLREPVDVVVRLYERDTSEVAVDVSADEASNADFLEMEGLDASTRWHALQETMKSLDGRVEFGGSTSWFSAFFIRGPTATISGEPSDQDVRSTGADIDGRDLVNR